MKQLSEGEQRSKETLFKGLFLWLQVTFTFSPSLMESKAPLFFYTEAFTGHDFPSSCSHHFPKRSTLITAELMEAYTFGHFFYTRGSAHLLFISTTKVCYCFVVCDLFETTSNQKKSLINRTFYSLKTNVYGPSCVLELVSATWGQCWVHKSEQMNEEKGRIES